LLRSLAEGGSVLTVMTEVVVVGHVLRVLFRGFEEPTVEGERVGVRREDCTVWAGESRGTKVTEQLEAL